VDNGTCIQADHVISTLPSQQTLSLLSPTAALPSLARVAPTSANVAVVNLTYYGRLKMPNGFGYLIPSTVPDTKALGVVFDSDALPGQDQGQNVTRMTVMLGGRSRWNHTFDTMSREDFIDEALNAVQKHLGIPDMPLDVQAHIHRSCIPQYGVGHVTALQQLHRELSQVYRGRLSLTGASYLGVSVNDCVWRALQLAKRLTTSTTEVVTGLEAADVL
jgi:oxygen-dependent protoporphyrinogen oxidase